MEIDHYAQILRSFFFFFHPRVTSHHNPISAANGKMESVLISFCKSRNDNFSLVLLIFSRVFHFKIVKTLTCECVLLNCLLEFHFSTDFQKFRRFLSMHDRETSGTRKTQFIIERQPKQNAQISQLTQGIIRLNEVLLLPMAVADSFFSIP